MKKSFFINIGCSLAVLAAVVIPAKAYAASLTLDWNNVDWQMKSLSQSFTVGKGEIAMEISGQTGALINQTPNDSIFLNGTSVSEEALYLQADFAQETELITLTANFLKFDAVKDVSFTLFDIDASKDISNTKKLNWQDRVVVQGFWQGKKVDPTFTAFDPTFIQATGNTLDGLKSVNNDRNEGNITVNFALPIDRFSITFTQNPDLTYPIAKKSQIENPQSHGIGVGDVQFTPTEIPESSNHLALLTFAFVTTSLMINGKQKQEKLTQKDS
jgi:hypothetical protein